MDGEFWKKFKKFRKAFKRYLRLVLNYLFSFFNYTYSLLLLRYTKLSFFHLRRKLRKNSIERLHVGCGPILLKGWCNVLFEKGQTYGRLKSVNGAVKLNYNLMKKWPWRENSLSFIAGAHFIEHLNLDQGLKFCAEAFRVLKSGGTIRLSCPDLELYARNYLEENRGFYEDKEIIYGCAFRNSAQTPSQIFVSKAYDNNGAHKWFHDFSSLKSILERAGFSHIRKVRRLEGQTPDLEQLEAPKREIETLYVEARKP